MDLATRTKAVGWAAIAVMIGAAGSGASFAGCLLAVVVVAFLLRALVRLQRGAATSAPGLDLRPVIAVVVAVGVGPVVLFAADRSGANGVAASVLATVLMLVGLERYTSAMGAWCRRHGWSPDRAYARARLLVWADLALVIALGVLALAGRHDDGGRELLRVGGTTWTTTAPTWVSVALALLALALLLWTVARVQFAQQELRDGLVAGAGQVPVGFTPTA